MQALARIPPVKKPGTIRDLGSADVTALASAVGQLSEAVWAGQDSCKENDFPVLGKTRHIVFRFIRHNRDPQDFYSNRIWDIWRPKLLPVMEQVTAGYRHRETVYPKVMLARLPAGERIGAHSDGQGSHAYTHKIHVPLISNPDAIFTVGDTAQHLEVGRAYEVNNIVHHSAINRGDEDRIHLIFEHFDQSRAYQQTGEEG
ncbi:aspartyl beta-hydroxylase [Altererythrobacter sp. RZ02]|uniref:Aspartyl beta-hydroxylase n=1 Tax=Pontixanthobacter rizhaonensis TaxID=2730337 RepID=A0A848QPK8_9SPHN|nr:aspartyl/asparaginyl beta-hydroxylase domain-containing protein [Pontixanthobacter rizhaonensis]NMW32537.1 aspartyl beta-hydroxylase [Pontixanthobacter rizhaonensis]